MPPDYTEDQDRYDIVIYGGTSSGIAAAIEASRLGKSVVLIEPTLRIGGLTTGGLGETDIGEKNSIGGISREFYQRVKAYYARPENWKWQDPADYKDEGQARTEAGEDTMWTFEPSAALKIFQSMLAEEPVDLVLEERLNREAGVTFKGCRIDALEMESGRVFRGQVFIDATYEGDLMAASNVSYTWGREANSDYGETLNGVQPDDYNTTLNGRSSWNAQNHNFLPGVDPYVVRGNPSSGLLPFLKAGGKPGIRGQRDPGIQAYCFRMTLTDHPENRIPFRKPEGYRELEYELLFRNVEAGSDRIPWINSHMPNRKTDTNNRWGFSTDFIGQNYAYPEASYAEREKIIEAHRRYQQGLMWTLSHHPRVPQNIRDEVGRWGTCKDEYEREDGWQQQLYIREARRLVSDFVMTQHHAEGLQTADDPIGLAAYPMDSHHVQRYVDANGHVRNEGNVQCCLERPYPISYRSIVPRSSECENLLVPVCLSATHIVFGSIRMEPVFMILGQSAANAAGLSIDQQRAVQDIDNLSLKNRLLKRGQRLDVQ